MPEKCEECGCVCAKCKNNDEKHRDMHLHAEIENLRQRLMERDSHIVTMETQFLNEADKFPNGELASTKEESRVWQEKYSRLSEAHKRIQKVNQNLEDKLLRIVDKCETEKGAFAKDIATLSHRLADANYTIHRLTQDNEKYRNDVNLAIQLLQCKPSNFVGQKYDSLPSEVQAKVRTYVAQKRRSSDASPPDVKSITVPISTFPPTAMVYNITKSSAEKHSDDESDDSKPPMDVVSAAIIAKVLEDRERERIFAKHCITCTCHRTILMVDSETQTNSERHDSRFCEECGTRDYPGVSKIIEFPRAKDAGSENPGETMSSALRRGTEAKLIGRVRGETSVNDNHSNFNNAKSRKNENSTKQKSTQMNIERASICKTTVNKTKQTRLSKRIDVDARTSLVNCEHWSKHENEPAFRVEKHNGKNEIPKELSPVDIINDRLWKSGWNNSKPLFSTSEIVDTGKSGADTEIDVINDRVWKNDRTQGNMKQTRMTLIEVTNAVNSSVLKDFGQTEVAISPSFSSDSVVISTSNQSSSSSDALHNINVEKRPLNNNSKSSWKERSAGPRNCFMRLTPGSKNILLDNAGQYQTVLYTSGTERPNTALVHVPKSARSDRSVSTSSEENSPIVGTSGSAQLQRVAEWVQSSVSPVNNDKNSGKTNSRDKISRPKTVPIFPEPKKDSSVKIEAEENRDNHVGGFASDNLLRGIGEEKNPDNPFADLSEKTGESPSKPQGELQEDLISFDIGNPDDGTSGIPEDEKDPNYEVKITKEMEEIYLKLTASLDPVTLKLSGSNSADLTIEKYRKDHRKMSVQKLHDKSK